MKRCEHGREGRRSRDCGGKGVCEHNRRRHDCKGCGGEMSLGDKVIVVVVVGARVCASTIGGAMIAKIAGARCCASMEDMWGQGCVRTWRQAHGMWGLQPLPLRRLRSLCCAQENQWQTTVCRLQSHLPTPKPLRHVAPGDEGECIPGKALPQDIRYRNLCNFLIMRQHETPRHRHRHWEHDGLR
ncbi:hypothetical protein DFS34DRAFT_164509 [Phlyctochytrium arcticum]|nr:hypothetical protein DFS34DRAFT_164509 [Phlyctochytrium arcticum]